MKKEQALNINEIHLSEARWRRLPPTLRAELLQVLGGKSAITGRQIIDLARALCAATPICWPDISTRASPASPSRPTAGVAWGVLMSLRDLMDEDPAELGATLLV